ncbi:MAG: hypothetical protein KAT25_03945 [Sulfuriflexus sp.]|nr:hypothetical protein [Sulfuriflexus sp.]
MATLVFRLNDVPDAEADAIRNLLLEHKIDFYETSAGNWGFSVAGIWLKNNEDKLQARSLIDDYQQHMPAVEADTESFTQLVLQQPLRVVIYFLIVLFIIYFSLMPFMNIGE